MSSSFPLTRLRNHLDEFEGDPRRRPLTVDELDAFFAACDERVGGVPREDLVGKTRQQLRSLHFRRDRDWLQS